MIRPIRLTDIWSLERRRQVASLNFPDSVVRDFSPARFSVRAALGPAGKGASGLLLSSRMRPLAACYYESPRSSEDARLLALSSFQDEEKALAAWERLIERACLRAAGDGKLRVLATPEEGSEEAHILRKLGFTVATREHVLIGRVPSTPPEWVPDFEPLSSDGVWDAWKLYNRTEPVPVQRADGLTPASWLRGRRIRRSQRQEWILRTDGELSVHQELVHGPRLSAARFHLDPERREALPAVVAHALALAARRHSTALYCVVREHQTELESYLLDSGFALVRSQVRLVLYTSILSHASELQRMTALEKPAPAFRTSISGISHGPYRGPGAQSDWYNLYEGEI